MTTSTQILNYLSSNKERYHQQYHLVRVGLFGSFARGEETSGSDIDLLVEFEDNTKRLMEVKQELKSEIQNRFDRPVDICREKYMNPIFKTHILSEVVYA
ncbi:MAG: nucleotidyltransferase domain-containing protein [Bacteroidales bacterium]|nr:nucleotidyltransferase domain-containing protein [Bacteroidales bacterium]